MFPGFGSLLSSIETAADKKAIITGKPNKFALECILDDHKIEMSKTLFIGDNMETDILCANSAGMDSALVFTGVTREEDF